MIDKVPCIIEIPKGSRNKYEWVDWASGDVAVKVIEEGHERFRAARRSGDSA